MHAHTHPPIKPSLHMRVRMDNVQAVRAYDVRLRLRFTLQLRTVRTVRSRRQWDVVVGSPRRRYFTVSAQVDILRMGSRR